MTDDLLKEKIPPIPEGFTQMNWTSGFGRQIGPLYELNGDLPDYRFAFRVEGHHVNGMDNCHGGMLMSFADVALGHAVSVAFNAYWVTVRLVTDFVSGARRGEWVEGTGEVTSRQGDLITVKGRIWVGDRTIMSGTGLFKDLGQRAAE
jgi:acyl-coenzyme A thioesterase PaaI-like protein